MLQKNGGTGTKAMGQTEIFFFSPTLDEACYVLDQHASWIFIVLAQ